MNDNEPWWPLALNQPSYVLPALQLLGDQLQLFCHLLQYSLFLFFVTGQVVLLVLLQAKRETWYKDTGRQKDLEQDCA